MSVLDRNLGRLRRLIGDILDQRGLEMSAIQLVPRSIQVGPFLREVIEEQIPFARQYRVRLQLTPVADDLWIMADRLRCVQVIGNLLSNAIKYSPVGSKVLISCTARNGCARFEFQDSGTGIHEEYRDKIFEKLTRIPETNPRNSDGSGLGLSIARDMLGLMNGKIDFRSNPGEGTCFWFELPRTSGVENRPAL